MGAEVAADETERQHESVPEAVRHISSRVALYYIAALFVLSLNVSANDPILSASVTNFKGTLLSPFVLMIQRAGIPILGHIVNAVILISVISVGNASLSSAVCLCCYLTNAMQSRTLCALALEGQAPRLFMRKNNFGTPWLALIVSALPGTLGFLSTIGSVSSSNEYLSSSNLKAGLGVFVKDLSRWCAILLGNHMCDLSSLLPSM